MMNFNGSTIFVAVTRLPSMQSMLMSVESLTIETEAIFAMAHSTRQMGCGQHGAIKVWMVW